MGQFPQPYHWLFKRACRQELYDELAGDLEETFDENLQAYGLQKARSIYKKEVIKMLRPSVIRPLNPFRQLRVNHMFKNYLKLSFRNLWRHKEPSLISIFGLSTGIIASVLMFQYTNFELSYDSMHDETAGKIYRVSRQTIKAATGEQISLNATQFHGFQPNVANEVPEVLSATKLVQASGVLTHQNEGYPVPNGMYTTGSFFEVFSFPLLDGNPESLDQPGSVFLSQSLAQKLFGTKDPMGQQIHYNDNFSNVDLELQVKGIFEDLPENTHIQAELMMSVQDQDRFADNGWFGSMRIPDVTWRWVGFHSYIRVNPQTSRDQLAQNLNNFIQKYREAFDQSQGRQTIAVPQELADLHFAQNVNGQIMPSADPEAIQIFRLIGVLIILIAWINYVNMASARAIKRAREVGVRKALGAHKKELIFQFLIETVVFNILALIIAIGFIFLLIPVFHQFVGKPVFSLFQHFSAFWFNFGLIFLGGAIVSGLYPAIILTRFEAIKVLRGIFCNSFHGIWFRRTLSFLQFGLVLLLLSGILIIRSQLNFMMKQDLGMQMDQTLIIDAPPAFIRDSTFVARFETFRGVTVNIPSVRQSSISSNIPGNPNNFGQTMYRTDRPSDESVFVYRYSVDSHYLPLFEIDLLAGRQFNESLKGDGRSILINEQSVAELEFESVEDAIGKKLHYPTGQDMTIIGVVRDFNPMGAKFKVDPMAINLDTARVGSFINVKLGTENLASTLDRLEDSYREFFPGAPFNSFFLEQNFRAVYEADQKFRSVLEFFALVSIFISSLGIFGLSSFLINQKMKEVSIRKVLGAGLGTILNVLCKEYLFLVGIAAIVSLPIAYLIADRWLSSFLVSISLHPLHFVLPLAGLALILLITIGRKTWHAAKVNPAVTLKNE